MAPADALNCARGRATDVRRGSESMFVRFVVGTDQENPHWLTGIVTIAEELHQQGELHDYEATIVSETFAWLNSHLPCPPFQKNLRTGRWSEDAVSWFRDDAAEALKRMWDIVAILREHGVPVRLVQTAKPGKIVYEDPYQVVAETPPWA